MKILQVEEWMETQSVKWKEEGNKRRNRRKTLGIKVADIASMLGVSVSRIYKLEAGKPIQDAKLLRNAYDLVLDTLSKDVLEVDEHCVIEEGNVFRIKVSEDNYQLCTINKIIGVADYPKEEVRDMVTEMKERAKKLQSYVKNWIY